ncbi:MAG: GT4 family glycosyltransferase PelF [Chloroflexales bacterium]
MHILLISEGTYPFHWGGVSTWCHLLIRDLPDVEFTLLSLVADPRYEPQFTLPDNVVHFRAIPLWGMCEMLEFQPDLTLAMLNQRRRQNTPDVVAREFIPIFRNFLCALYTSDSHPDQLGQLIHQMYRFFQAYDFDTTMRCQATWDCFTAAAHDYFPQTAAQHGYPAATYALWDVTQGLQWLYHWLFPLANPLPKTDIAHASIAGISTMIAVVAKLEYGAAYMLSEHGIYLRERYLAEAASSNCMFLKLLSLRFARRMSQLSYALADQISPCCDYNQRWELHNGASPDRLHTIYYGADSGKFVPGGKPVGDPPVVVWVGRISPLKDVITLLKAAALVKETRPDIEFRLFGSAEPKDASYYAECLDLWAELGLQQTVRFAGYVSNAADAYNEGDVVVLCSISEGFPFAILEAMLCGKPVVATAVGGVPEQIEGCGISVEPRSSQELAAAITTLMNDTERCAVLGRAARERAVQEFTVHQSAEAHRSSYQQLLRQHPSPVAVPMQGAERAVGTNELMFSTVASQDEPELLEMEVGGARPAPPPSNNRHQSVGNHSVRNYLLNEPITWVTPDAAAISALADEVLQHDTHPIDYLEITAVLESIGITDQIAIQHYGVPDTFALAENVLEHIRATYIPPQAGELRHQPEPRTSFWQVIRDYAKGPIALTTNLLLLLIISVYAQLGQWNAQQVLALSMGMTGGMLCSNGFVQAFMRRASLSLSLSSPQTAGRFLRMSFAFAGVALSGVALLAFLAAGWMDLLTLQERMVFVLSFLALSAIWLMASVLSLIQMSNWLGIGLATGLLTGYVVDRLAAPFSSIHIAFGSAVGFATIIGVIYYPMRSIFNTPSKGQRIFLPSMAYLIHEALPYFAYGSLYMLFILIPHLFGWLGALGPGQSRSLGIAILEASLTLSLPPLVLVSGVAERTLRHFWLRSQAAQYATPGHGPGQFGQVLASFYWRQLRFYLLALATISAVAYTLFQLAVSSKLLPDWLILSSLSTFGLMFQIGLVTYFLLGWGWFNCMFSLTLGRPQMAIQAVIVGIIATVIVGTPLSLGVHFSYAALGFLVGALAFAAESARLTYRLFRSCDYYYYTSY